MSMTHTIVQKNSSSPRTKSPLGTMQRSISKNLVFFIESKKKSVFAGAPISSVLLKVRYLKNRSLSDANHQMFFL